MYHVLLHVTYVLCGQLGVQFGKQVKVWYVPEDSCN